MNLKRLASLVLLLFLAPPLGAAPLLYRLQDADNTVWLLGSVHALRASDYPLDARIEEAYRSAERVVLEVSPAEMDPAQLAGVALPLARWTDGRRLPDVLSPEQYARLRRHAATLGLDLRQLHDFEPWFVALQLFALQLSRSGYASAQGVDRHFAERALEDGKRTGGLETAEEQFGMFDGLPLETQKAFLLSSLEDDGEFARELERIVSAWRRGDAAALAALLESEFGGEPLLRDALLEARNRRWAEAVETHLAGTDDTLVIVGALHLVGDQGLVELLRQRGHETVKVTSAE